MRTFIQSLSIALLLCFAAFSLPASAAEPRSQFHSPGLSRVAVLAVCFQDWCPQETTPQQTADVINSFATAGVNGYYEEVAYGAKWFQAETPITTWIVLPLNAAGCSTGTGTVEAIDEATARGVDLDQYQHLVIVKPSGCSGASAGTIGAFTDFTQSPPVSHPYAITWLNGPASAVSWWRAAHELGHNLGLGHPYSLKCAGGAYIALDIIASCPITDSTPQWFCDLIGNGCTGHFNAAAKSPRFMGWEDTPRITAAGRYRLQPVEVDPDVQPGPRSYRILRAGDPALGTEEWIYMERRRAFGYDAGLANLTNQTYTQGVILTVTRNANTGYDLNGLEIDMRQDTSHNADAALVAGMCFEDPLSGVAIALASQNADGSADVDVTFGFSGCNAPPPPPVNNPPVAVADSAAAAPGQSILIPVLANDSDPDGDLLTIASVTQPSKGTAVIEGNQVRYTAPTRWKGPGVTSFTYTISDGRGGTASATVMVTRL